jgi:NADH-quinone oxidoreductase subunit E
MNSSSVQASPDLDQDFIDKVVQEQHGRPGALLGILQKAQNNHPRKFLPQETLEYIGTRTGIPLSRIYSVVTFYAGFNLEPQGRNTVCVCRGTACHTRGSRGLLERVTMNLGLNVDDEGEEKLSATTADGSITLRTVACFGQCALAPVVEVNHAIYGHMNERTLLRELEALKRRELRT